MDFETLLKRSASGATQTLVGEALPGRIGQALGEGAGSAISGLLDLPPKRVAVPDAPLSEPETFAEPDEGNPFDTVLTTLQQEMAPEPEPDEPVFVPLTKAEISAKAESKAEMWSAVIALVISLTNRLVAYSKLTETDRKWIRKHDRHVELHGNPPAYDNNHPYFDARDHYDAYEQALEEGGQTAPLDEAQKELLRRAIEADLHGKNKREALQQTGIAMTLAEIMFTKMTEPLMGVGLALVAKLTDHSIRKHR
jgi:hypothetical protein